MTSSSGKDSVLDGNPGRRRRGRPPSIDSAVLLRVAREVFLEKGIRATTLDVAQRAGVSEGIIFHRFKSKEGLFREAMQLSQDDVPKLLLNAVERLEGLPLEGALHQFGRALLEIAEVGLPLMMMSWSNPHCGTPDDKVHRFREFLDRLVAFFRGHIQRGDLREVDPEVVARVFLGSLHHYALSRIMAGEHAIPLLPADTVLGGLIDVVLRGAGPRAPAPTAPSSH